jgi:hypothetical protein
MLIKPEPQVLATAAAPRTSSLEEEGAGGACAAQKRAGRDVTTTPHDEEGEEGARPAALNLSTAAHQSLSSLYAQQERKMTLKQVGVPYLPPGFRWYVLV